MWTSPDREPARERVVAAAIVGGHQVQEDALRNAARSAGILTGRLFRITKQRSGWPRVVRRMLAPSARDDDDAQLARASAVLRALLAPAVAADVVGDGEPRLALHEQVARLLPLAPIDSTALTVLCSHG